MKKDSKELSFESKSIRTQADRSAFREHSVPIYMTSSFVFDDAEQARALFADEIPGNIYTRFSNPNSTEFIEKMCSLEHAEDGITTASGMSAVFVSLAAFLKTGDHIVSSRALFGSSLQIMNTILPKWGIQVSFAEGSRTEDFSAKFQPNTKMVFLETPSNPALEIMNISEIAKLCKEKNIILNVDNCFCTPYLQNPILLGADIITHSGTKYLDGQGRVIGGCVLGKKELIKEARFFARHSGPSLSPFNAWILSKSLETLSLRMERHCSNALELANRLSSHKKIQTVLYPFLDSHPQVTLAKKQMKLGGGIVSFVLKDGLEAGKNFLNSLEFLSHTANLGDSRTIATHPASTTHSKVSDVEKEKLGILPGLIRISVGLEGIDDIYSDILQALDA